MLDALGLSAQHEAVYRAILDEPTMGLSDLAQHLSISEDVVRDALDYLADLALVRFASIDGTRVARAVRPQAGLMALLSRAEAEISARQRQIEATRDAITALALVHNNDGESGILRRIEGVDQVRDRLADLAVTAQTECLSFSTGGKQSPEAIAAERPLNKLALDRGVSIRNVYLESFRNDPATLAYAEWMAKQGGASRTVPCLPIRLVIVDRAIAMVPIDPDAPRLGAVEVTSPGLVRGLYALFERVWESGTPFGEPPARDDHGLDPQERELLRLYAAGHTDASAARKLAVSTRSVQRIMTTITERLGTASRFQTAVEATRRGWVDPL